MRTRERITKLRNEFCGLQTDATASLLRDQSSHFSKATGLMWKKLYMEHANEVQELEKVIERAREDERKRHDIQQENLELQITRIPRPRVKYSKRMIELFKAESG